MTTYPDTAQDSVEGEGAYIIGGGSENFGQDYNETSIRNMFKVPAPTVENMLTVIEDSLGRVPLDSLKGFEGLIDAEEGAFDSQGSAVSTIMGSFNEIPAFTSHQTFDSWVSDLFDSFVQGSTGTNDSGFDITDFFNAASAQKKELDRMNAGLASLASDIAANNNSGRTLQVAVSDYDTVPSVFTQAYANGSGTITNDGDTLEMSNHDFLVMYRYNVAELVTDYFEVSMVVPRQTWDWFGNYGDRSLLFVGRANIGWTDLVFARLNGTTLSVGCVDGGMEGTYHYFGSGGTGSGPAEVTVPRGSYMTFRGGTIAGDRVFQFLVGNTVVATFKDNGDVSKLGPLYRWTGFGMWNDAGPDLINRSGNMSHFVANDNQPAPVVGRGGTMVRLSDSNIALSSGVNEFPSGFFDSIEEMGEGFTYDVSAGEFVVTAGWWTISVGVEVASAWGTHFNLVVFRDGIPWKHMTTDKGFSTEFFGNSVLPDRVTGAFTGYFPEGCTVTVGYYASGEVANALTGNADGASTYFTMAKVG